MPNLPDLQPLLEQVKREMEDTIYSPPEWVVDRLKRMRPAEHVGE